MTYFVLRVSNVSADDDNNSSSEVHLVDELPPGSYIGDISEVEDAEVKEKELPSIRVHKKFSSKKVSEFVKTDN